MAEDATLTHTFTSLIAVKSKTGELDALANMEPGEARRVRPMLEVVANLRVNETPEVWKSFGKAMLNLQRCQAPVMIDCSRLSVSSALWSQSQGPEWFMVAQAEQEYGLFQPDTVPVIACVRSDASDGRLKNVARLVHYLGTGVGVRVLRAGAAERHNLAEEITRALRLLRVDRADVDLILDAELIEKKIGATVEALRPRLDTLAPMGFRSLTVLSGSVPKDRSTLREGSLRRAELELWRLVTAERSEAEVRYGDYGIVTPLVQDDEGGGRSPDPYMFYTVPGEMRFTRRKPRKRKGTNKLLPGEAMADYFVDIAHEITDSDYYAGAEFSWGDGELDSYACPGSSCDKAGSAPHWIAIGTSHHIAHLAAGGDLPYGDQADVVPEQ